MSSATAQVLSTPELLEAILLHLPMQDLLLSQRVNKKFKGVIDGSIHLQRALFFEPIPQTGQNLDPVINPLFAGGKPDLGWAIPWDARQLIDSRLSAAFDMISLGDGSNREWLEMQPNLSLVFCLERNFWLELSSSKAMREYEQRPAEESWRRMLVQQTMTKQKTVMVLEFERTKRWWYCIEEPSKTGVVGLEDLIVKVATLYDA